MITRAKELMQRIRQGWELWHVGDSPLPGRWELRRGREQEQVTWDAIIVLRKHFLRELDALVDSRQEGRFTWAYVPKQRRLPAQDLAGRLPQI
jgi:hypothetical protein